MDKGIKIGNEVIKKVGYSPRGLIMILCLFIISGFSSNGASQAPPYSFQVVLIPDTQIYARDHPDIYTGQFRWIRNNIEHRNFKFVIHLGDLVQNPNNYPQWVTTDEAFALIDGYVPYTVVPGNHEMPMENGKRSREMNRFNRVFSPDRFFAKKGYGGYMGDSFANNYMFFEGGGMKFMVVGLEHYPRDKALEWANQIIAQHPDHRVIVATHWYLFRDGSRHRPTRTNVKGNNGEEIWQKLGRKHENIFMIVSGHISGQAKLTSKNDAGEPVHQILTDFQRRPDGGEGYLRTLKFIPSRDEIEVETYSPHLIKTLRGPEFSYTLPYEMTDDYCDCQD